MAVKRSTEIGDAAVKAKTGKTWPQWFSVLEKAGARRMTARRRAHAGGSSGPPG